MNYFDLIFVVFRPYHRRRLGVSSQRSRQDFLACREVSHA